jgi:hypothetical protein
MNPASDISIWTSNKLQNTDIVGQIRCDYIRKCRSVKSEVECCRNWFVRQGIIGQVGENLVRKYQASGAV